MADAPESRTDAAERGSARATALSTPPPAESFLSRLGEACGLGLAAALVTSLPVALRATGEGGSPLGGLLASAAVLTVPLTAVLYLRHAAGRGYRMVTGRGAGRSTAVGLALWGGLSAPILLVLGAGLGLATHHRGLGGATFGALAFGVALVAALAAHRLVVIGRRFVERGTATARTVERVSFGAAALPALGAACLALSASDGTEASSRLLAAVVDGALGLVATVLAASHDVPARARRAVRRGGFVLATIVVVSGFTWVERSPELARAVKGRGGLGPAILSGLETWTDKDGDGAGARFGGGDCDDGDPRRQPRAEDLEGDGLDADCDGRDAARGQPARTVVAKAPAPASDPSAAPAPGAGDGPTSVASLRKQPARPDILLVTLDGVRADHTSAQGYAHPTTPALQALAARGVLFEHAYAVASDTQRVLTPLVSGRRLSRTARDSREWPTIAGSVDAIAERVGRAGYATAAVTSFTWLSRDRGFDQGFDDFEAVYEKDHPERGVTGAHALAAARAILARRADEERPLFLWVHLFDAHERFIDHPGLDFGKGKTALYDGEVAFVDRQLGGLLETVAASPRGARTAVIVHGSHGMGLGEHGVDGHGADLWEPQIHVPLVIALPGAASARYARGAVSIADLPATVLELAGADHADVEGTSLLPLARGGEEPAPPVWVRTRRRAAVIDWPLKLLTTKRRGKDRHLLFDLSADPGEEKDLSADRAEDLVRLIDLSDRFEKGEGASDDER